MTLLSKASLIVTPNRYESGKVYSLKPTNRAADAIYSRSGNAPRINGLGVWETLAANMPRIDNQVGGGCPHILCEPQRTDYCLHSNDLTDAVWNLLFTGTGTTPPIITPNYAVAPDGSITATRVQATIGPDGYSLVQQVILLAGESTGSMWVKSNTGSAQSIYFRVENTTIPKTVPVSWTKIEVSEANGNFMSFGLRDTAGFSNTSIDILVWKPKVEPGLSATTGLLTSGSAITRNADVISKTGISESIGQTEGVIVLDTYLDELAKTNLSLNDGTGSNIIELASNSAGAITATVKASGSTQAAITSSNYIKGTRLNIVFAYKSNDFDLYINGTQIGTDVSGSVPTMSAFSFSKYDGSQIATQRINKLILFKTRLSNSECQSLSTI